MKVKCPTCSATTEYEIKNPHRPFCSERCRTLDLGAWADEKFRVPASEDASTVNEKSGAHAADGDPTPPKHHLN